MATGFIDKARSTVRAGNEMLVAPAALASARHNMRLLVGNIRYNASGFRVLHKGSHRNLYDKIRCGFAGAALGKAGLAVLCGVIFLVLKVDANPVLSVILV